MLIGFLVAIGPCFLSLRSRYRSRFSHFPILLGAQLPKSAHGTQVPFSDIRAIELRENTGRCEVDDSAYAQIYVRHRDESRLLIYQSYLSYKNKTRQLAAKIAEVAGAPLVDQL